MENNLSKFGVRIRRNYKIKKFNNSDYKVIEICGGKNPLEKNNLNIDVMDHPLVDLVSNVKNRNTNTR